MEDIIIETADKKIMEQQADRISLLEEKLDKIIGEILIGVELQHK